ncbi:MAG: outer membrane protein assembly factor BamB [Kiritimatiellia bacterium]|jgi:outer membrane protein assembly factor BamB
MNRRLYSRATLLAAVLAAFVLSDLRDARSEDWPRLLGPDQNSQSSETNLLLNWPDAGPPVLWRKALGTGFSPPVISKNHVLIFHRKGNSAILEALDAVTGAPKWSYTYETHYEDRYGFNGGPRSAPAISEDRVYAIGAEGLLSCLSLDLGTVIWKRHVIEDFGVSQNFFGVGVSPVISDGLVLLNIGATNGAGIVAFDAVTGETRWQASGEEASYSTPVTASINGKHLAFFLARGGLVVLETKTGRIVDEYPFRARKHESVNAASPLVIDDTVLISSSYRVGSARLRVGAEGLEEVWVDKVTMQNHWATCIQSGDVLYGCNGRHENEATLRCLSLADGSLRWEAPRGLGRSTYIMVAGHLIGVGERGDLVLIEAHPDRYIEKARVRLFAHPAWAPPSLSNGLLYVRDETQIVCMDLRKGDAHE